MPTRDTSGGTSDTSPWVVGAVAFAVTFPLLFVLEKPKVLMPLAVGVLAIDIPLSLGLREAFGLRGLVIALALSTFLVIVVLMAAVSMRMLVLTAFGVARTALLVAALVVASFGLAEVIADGFVAAGLGLAIYVSGLAILRPRGLVEAWQYMRLLHN